jgi:HAD superfamily hydrolase (TIGR01549 family)
MAIRGIIFDMDGTITVPYFDFTKIRAEANIGDRDMLDYLREATGAEYERIHGILLKYEEAAISEAKLNTGAREVLDYLAEAGIPTALLTRNSRKSVEAVCRSLHLHFDITVTREDGPHKPAPEPIWNIAKRWGIDPKDVLMVGDYKWDVMCADNAGIRCALLTNGEGVPEWGRHVKFIIHTLPELITIIDRENA